MPPKPSAPKKTSNKDANGRVVYMTATGVERVHVKSKATGKMVWRAPSTAQQVGKKKTKVQMGGADVLQGDLQVFFDSNGIKQQGNEYYVIVDNKTPKSFETPRTLRVTDSNKTYNFVLDRSDVAVYKFEGKDYRKLVEPFYYDNGYYVLEEYSYGPPKVLSKIPTKLFSKGTPIPLGDNAVTYTINYAIPPVDLKNNGKMYLRLIPNVIVPSSSQFNVAKQGFFDGFAEHFSSGTDASEKQRTKDRTRAWETN